MEEKISLIDKGKVSSRIHLYEIGLHNIMDKEIFTEDEIEHIAQTIKQKFIEELSKNVL